MTLVTLYFKYTFISDLFKNLCHQQNQDFNMFHFQKNTTETRLEEILKKETLLI